MKFLKETLSKYPNIYRTDKEDDSDKAEYYTNISGELLKYYSTEDIFVENHCITPKSGRVDFSINHPKRNPQTTVYIRFVNIPGMNTVQSNLDIWIFYQGSFIGSEYLSIEKFPEVVKAFVELDNSFDKVLEEIAIEKGKDKKMSDMIGVTIKTLIEKKFGDKISEVGAYLDGNTLIVHVSKTSRNKATFKINIKKFENNFDVILDGVEHLLKFQSYDWLKFEYKGL
jgi:hypothetical protein